jgi:hypothetical protein
VSSHPRGASLPSCEPRSIEGRQGSAASSVRPVLSLFGVSVLVQVAHERGVDRAVNSSWRGRDVRSLKRTPQRSTARRAFRLDGRSPACWGYSAMIPVDGVSIPPQRGSTMLQRGTFPSGVRAGTRSLRGFLRVQTDEPRRAPDLVQSLRGIRAASADVLYRNGKSTKSLCLF